MEKWKGGGIRYWDQEFKMINVVVFGKYKKIVHDSTSIMNVEACKISLGMHTMSAAGPPQILVQYNFIFIYSFNNCFYIPVGQVTTEFPELIV